MFPLCGFYAALDISQYATLRAGQWCSVDWNFHVGRWKARYSVLVGRLAFTLPATVNERNFRRGFDIYLSFPTSRVVRGSHTKYRFDIYNCFLINGHYNGKIKPVSILLPFKHTSELKIEFLHQLVSVKIYVSYINLY